jgi:hypothetical protein
LDRKARRFSRILLPIMANNRFPHPKESERIGASPTAGRGVKTKTRVVAVFNALDEQPCSSAVESDAQVMTSHRDLMHENGR